LDQSDRVGAKSPIFDLFARSDSALTPSEKKVQLTLIGSPLRALQRTQDKQRTLSLSPQTVAQKRSVQNLNNELQ